ncbi:MAG: hypothetical protein QOJ05_1363 [Verrucomicrobiota bacterium]
MSIVANTTRYSIVVSFRESVSIFRERPAHRRLAFAVRKLPGVRALNEGLALPLGVSEALPDDDEIKCRQGNWADGDEIIHNAPL